MRFTIKRKLPSLNETINANRRNAFAGAKLKQDTENDICWFIRIGLQQGTLSKCEKYPVDIYIKWHERTRKRDVDNIQSSQKFILDSLTKMGILTDDSRRYVRQIYHLVVDDTEDFVEVMIKDITSEEGQDGDK